MKTKENLEGFDRFIQDMKELREKLHFTRRKTELEIFCDLHQNL